MTQEQCHIFARSAISLLIQGMRRIINEYDRDILLPWPHRWTMRITFFADEKTFPRCILVLVITASWATPEIFAEHKVEFLPSLKVFSSCRRDFFFVPPRFFFVPRTRVISQRRRIKPKKTPPPRKDVELHVGRTTPVHSLFRSDGRNIGHGLFPVSLDSTFGTNDFQFHGQTFFFKFWTKSKRFSLKRFDTSNVTCILFCHRNDFSLLSRYVDSL